MPNFDVLSTRSLVFLVFYIVFGPFFVNEYKSLLTVRGTDWAKTPFSGGQIGRSGGQIGQTIHILQGEVQGDRLGKVLPLTGGR